MLKQTQIVHITSNCGSIERDLPVTVEIELGERDASLPAIQFPQTVMESVIRTTNALQLVILWFGIPPSSISAAIFSHWNGQERVSSRYCIRCFVLAEFLYFVETQ